MSIQTDSCVYALLCLTKNVNEAEILIGCGNGLIHLYTFSYLDSTFNLKQTLATKHSERVSCLIKLNEDDDLVVASASWDKSVIVWSRVNRESSLEFAYLLKQTHTDIITKLVNIDNELMASSAKDRTIVIWHKTKENCIQKQILKEHTRNIHDMIFIGEQSAMLSQS